MREKIDKLEKCVKQFGRKVLALHRAKIGDIVVKDLELGKWRYLKDYEVKNLIKKKLVIYKR